MTAVESKRMHNSSNLNSYRTAVFIIVINFCIRFQCMQSLFVYVKQRDIKNTLWFHTKICVLYGWLCK